VHDAFALLHELLDEVAQAKFFGIDLGHMALSIGSRQRESCDLTGVA
jgi:hypothetical protein